MLSAHRHRTAGVRRAIGLAAARVRLSPNGVTLASLALAAAAAALLATGRFMTAAAVATVAAGLDFVDGELARLTGRVTKWGGYLDSLVDRFVDFGLLLGILLALDTRAAWVVGAAALFGSVTTSFAKARVYQDAQPDPKVWRRDLLERPDRYAILLPAIFAHGLAIGLGRPLPILFWALVLLALLSNLTVLQRMATARRVLGDLDGR